MPGRCDVTPAAAAAVVVRALQAGLYNVVRRPPGGRDQWTAQLILVKVNALHMAHHQPTYRTATAQLLFRMMHVIYVYSY